MTVGEWRKAFLLLYIFTKGVQEVDLRKMVVNVLSSKMMMILDYWRHRWNKLMVVCGLLGSVPYPWSRNAQALPGNGRLLK